tara:strand:- start:3464 stop:4969 length:1506 start_codon:yes stop_codon:yes gene_type:complete
MSVDWRGLSMAVAQLKELSEPGKMELMEREYELRAVENERNRAFEESKFVYEAQKNTYEENERKIETVRQGIMEMDASALKLNELDQSPDFASLVDANDVQYKNRLDKVNSDIELKLEEQTDKLKNISTLYQNMMFGKQIRESQGGSLYNTVTENQQVTFSNDDWANMNESERMTVVEQLNNNEKTDQWDVDSLNNYLQNNSMEWQTNIETEVGWDANNDGVISSVEYNNALEDTINDMEANDLDTTGIREGFYSGFNPIENDQNNLDVLNAQIQVEQNMLDFQQDLDGDDDEDTAYEKGVKSGITKNVKDEIVDEKEKLNNKVYAMKNFKKDYGVYEKNKTVKDDKEVFSPDKGEANGVTKAEWEVAREETKKHLLSFGADYQTLKPNPLAERTNYPWYKNSPDWIDNGFDDALEDILINFEIEGATDEETFKLGLGLKQEFNWMIENWEAFRNKQLTVDGDLVKGRAKFIEIYNEFKELLPDHFSQYDDDILSKWGEDD